MSVRRLADFLNLDALDRGNVIKTMPEHSESACGSLVHFITQCSRTSCPPGHIGQV